jgi:DNA-binding response OmpR family regulator
MAKILVVEDDIDLCEIVADALKMEGHLVEVCHNGQDALARLFVSGYDMLLIDWDLPGGTSGIDICIKDARQGQHCAGNDDDR